MAPLITIITPSLQRESLRRACASVDSQTFTGWQHIVMLDVADVNELMFHDIYHPQRKVIQCDYPHRNYGNTCRHKAWMHAEGDFLLGLDDDNYLADDRVLEDLAAVLQDVRHWAIFPILRHGQRFFGDPPGCCHTDTANVVVRREIGRWPDGPEYTMDGIWVDALKAQYTYSAFPKFRPIVVMPTSGEGK